MAEETPQRTDGGQSDRVTEQVQDDEPSTVAEAVTDAADKDPALSMEWEKKIKDKLTGNNS